MNIKKQYCAYCNSKKATTSDHVPPKSFFPKPLPANMITVPSCDECNNNKGKDEKYFLATFMFSEAGVTSSGKKLWEQKLYRMYKKNTGLRHKIVKSVKRLNVFTPSGIFIRRGLAIGMDEVRLSKVIDKIVRGLYFFEYKTYLSNSIEILSQFLQSQEDGAEAEKFKDQLLFGSRQWPNSFEYLFNRIQDKPDCSMWVIRFWGKIVFWAISGNDSDFILNTDHRQLTSGSS